jgi:hypothetical protein
MTAWIITSYSDDWFMAYFLLMDWLASHSENHWGITLMDYFL